MNQKDEVIVTTLPSREVVVAGVTYKVPRGVARNNRNRCWQVKIERNGQVIASGNHTDDSYMSTQKALNAAITAVEDILKDETEDKGLSVTKRVKLSWRNVGRNVLGISASVYNPRKKRASVVYMLSYHKIQSGKTSELKRKLLKALILEHQQETQQKSLPVEVLSRVEKIANDLLASKEWEEFLAMGESIVMTEEYPF